MSHNDLSHTPLLNMFMSTQIPVIDNRPYVAGNTPSKIVLNGCVENPTHFVHWYNGYMGNVIHLTSARYRQLPAGTKRQ